MKPKKSTIRNRYVLIIDMILMLIAVVGSYGLRLEFSKAYSQYFPSAFWMMGLALVVKPLVYYYFGLYRRLWLYASIQELKLIVTAVTAASVLLSGMMMGLFAAKTFINFPRSVLVIDWLLSVFLVGGLRFSLRLIAEAGQIPQTFTSKTRRALIVGAGDAGALVVRELQKNPQINIEPIGFLDDNPDKLNQQIHGVKVLGMISELDKIVLTHRVQEVIIAIPSAPGRVVRLVADLCRKTGINFRTMPGIYELLGGKVSISRLREVDIADLLRREPTTLKEELIGATIGGRIVLVTGAGGSIGREICRQVSRWGPSELILLGHGENSIFESLLEFHETFSGLPIRPVICDVRDKERLMEVFQQHKPQVVFHAAAHKHVPLMETNVEEAVTNNILGTRNIVEVCSAFNVQRLVMISTDKAIRPVNVMGATKRMAEMLVLDAAHAQNKPFSVVRFGNVLGSRGSVVPLFKRQIAKGGPITITHPDMRRYFMTIPEAVYLVLQAASLGEGGETFVLDMGEQVRILDLAEDLIRLSGLEPGKDIEIVFTGIRPGEKLSEDLWDERCQFKPTGHPELFCLEEPQNLEGDRLSSVVDELIRLARKGDSTGIIAKMDAVIPDAAVRSTPPQEITAID
jgi:FlaA1/EpsC-like NDP-sugar epimerase